MTITITHACGCERSIEVKGIRESKQYQAWLATKECPDCHVSPELAQELEALADETHIERRERTNSRGQTYPQWFDSDGKMVGCGCDEAQAVHIEKYNFKPCGHMAVHNAQREVGWLPAESITGCDLVAHVEDELRNSCCVCGSYTKQVICWRCLA